jgi:hypothetical protein
MNTSVSFLFFCPFSLVFRPISSFNKCPYWQTVKFDYYTNLHCNSGLGYIINIYQENNLLFSFTGVLDILYPLRRKFGYSVPHENASCILYLNKRVYTCVPKERSSYILYLRSRVYIFCISGEGLIYSFCTSVKRIYSVPKKDICFLYPGRKVIYCTWKALPFVYLLFLRGRLLNSVP